MNLAELQRLVDAGESETVELKKSTAQLSRAGETLCAFLNGQGGDVVLDEEMSVAPGRGKNRATIRRFRPPQSALFGRRSGRPSLREGPGWGFWETNQW